MEPPSPALAVTVWRAAATGSKTASTVRSETTFSTLRVLPSSLPGASSPSTVCSFSR